MIFRIFNFPFPLTIDRFLSGQEKYNKTVRKLFDSTFNKLTRFWLEKRSKINTKLYSTGVPITSPNLFKASSITVHYPKFSNGYFILHHVGHGWPERLRGFWGYTKVFRRVPKISKSLPESLSSKGFRSLPEVFRVFSSWHEGFSFMIRG